VLSPIFKFYFCPISEIFSSIEKQEQQNVIKFTLFRSNIWSKGRTRDSFNGTDQIWLRLRGFQLMLGSKVNFTLKRQCPWRSLLLRVGGELRELLWPQLKGVLLRMILSFKADYNLNLFFVPKIKLLLWKYVYWLWKCAIIIKLVLHVRCKTSSIILSDK